MQGAHPFQISRKWLSITGLGIALIFLNPAIIWGLNSPPVDQETDTATTTATATSYARDSKWAATIKPIGLLAGMPGAGVEFLLTDFLVLGGSLDYFSSANRFQITRNWEAAGHLTVSLTGTGYQNGFFLKSAFSYCFLKSSVVSNSMTTYYRLRVLNETFGYRWRPFINPILLTVGGGIIYYDSIYTNANFQPTLEFTLGWVF